MSITAAHSVEISGIAPQTTQQTIYDFFAFCGKINDVKLVGEGTEKKTATVSFEKATAAKTALMLNGGTLDSATLTVTSDNEPIETSTTAGEKSEDPNHIDQTDKPRAGIAAEYLARGYTLSDPILQRAIDLDQQHGISSRFLAYLNKLNSGELNVPSVAGRGGGTVGEAVGLSQGQTFSDKVLGNVKAVDEQRGISKTAHEYYQSAISSPLGQRVFSFYSSTSKQVFDIHEEARRIADSNKTKATGGNPAAAAPTPAPGGTFTDASADAVASATGK